MAWVTNNNLTLEQSWHYGLLVVIAAVATAYLAMRFYDLPIREWLRKKFL